MDSYNATKSVWSSAPGVDSSFQPLTGNTTADVAVVGGGITGISAAYNLSGKGLKVIVLEAGKVGEGSTGSSTGNLYVPTGQFQTILSKHGQKGLDAVTGSRAAAMTFIEDRINEFGIDCGYKRVPWHYFTSRVRSVKEIRNESDAIRAAGITNDDSIPDIFPFPIESVTTVGMQAQFNPLQYVKKLAAAIEGENCIIHENTRVLNITDGEPCKVETEKGVVTAKYVIQATHTPKGLYAVHAIMEVYREYALAFRINGMMPADGIYWLRDGKNKYSIRTYYNGNDSYLIVLDDSHKVGTKERTQLSYKKIEAYIQPYFDIKEKAFLWAAQNYSPADYLPYIGTSPLQKNVLIATGFSADGLTYGTAASMILSDYITRTPNPYAEVFDPKRLTIAASVKKAVQENITVVANLVRDYVFTGTEKALSSVRKGKGKIVEFEEEKAAAYRDDDGRLHIVSAKCTHLGCIVHWNSAEKSWDCPCHGSRFTVDGKVIEGPAMSDLKNYSAG